MLQKYQIIPLVVLLSLGLASVAHSDEMIDNDNEWRLSLAPYIWAASVRGDAGHPRVGTHFVKSSFSDIVNDVDLAAMVMGSARKGRYSILMDFMYIHGKVTQRLPVNIPASHILAKGKVMSGFVGAGYTIYSTDTVRLDTVLGLRGWHADVDLGLRGGPLNGISATTKKNWMDVTAGLRGLYRFNDDLSVTYWSLAGGGQAKSDWDLALLGNWAINKDLTITAGYRAIGVDYRKNGYVYDIVQQGPMIGLTFKF
ncbi:hypothetical protein [Wohlfahrtiimonas larvae]|uniref:Outer membrane protein beta-barrel domain-containing protein n=1 Tax=Wohlfahrtiimonas larvae TaxID=1157986 RepID=A0ABP9MXQ0_9GAMM|nr:hypothetical protein [Wohlfahrtiimonas larvae]